MDSVPGENTLENVWNDLVNAAKLCSVDLEENEYFAGVLEGQLYTLSVLADYLGKNKEYINLCREIDSVSRQN